MFKIKTSFSGRYGPFQASVLTILFLFSTSGFASCNAQPPVAAANPAFSGSPANEGYKIMYQSMWQFIGDNYFDPARLSNWPALEHAYDDKLGTLADIEIAFKALADATGDKWTTFVTQQEMRERAALEKQGFVNSGLMLYRRGAHYKIDVIEYGSAAYNTPLRERDIVECLNDIAIDTLDFKQVQTLLRGTSGESLKVKAVSNLDGQEYEVNLQLSPVPAPEVEGRLLADGLIYIRLPSFAGENYVKSFLAKYEELKVKSGSGVAGMVLDLRNNLGGELPAAIKFSSLFLDESKVVTQSVLRNKPVKIVYAEKADSIVLQGDKVDPAIVTELRSLPLVILVNGSSASASEVTIGALHDNGRGLVIGDTTFGKGVGYKTQRGPVGGLMSLTAYKYLTPLGHEVHEIGIKPDVSVHGSEGEDLQIKAALGALKEKTAAQ